MVEVVAKLCEHRPVLVLRQGLPPNEERQSVRNLQAVKRRERNLAGRLNDGLCRVRASNVAIPRRESGLRDP